MRAFEDGMQVIIAVADPKLPSVWEEFYRGRGRERSGWWQADQPWAETALKAGLRSPPEAFVVRRCQLLFASHRGEAVG